MSGFHCHYTLEIWLKKCGLTAKNGDRRCVFDESTEEVTRLYNKILADVLPISSHLSFGITDSQKLMCRNCFRKFECTIVLFKELSSGIQNYSEKNKQTQEMPVPQQVVSGLSSSIHHSAAVRAGKIKCSGELALLPMKITALSHNVPSTSSAKPPKMSPGVSVSCSVACHSALFQVHSLFRLLLVIRVNQKATYLLQVEKISEWLSQEESPALLPLIA